MTYEKHIHFNYEMETTVLGCLLLEPNLFDKVYNVIKPDVFFHADTKQVYEHMEVMYNMGHPLDLITVANNLYEAGVMEIKQVNSFAYLGNLTLPIVSTANIAFYAFKLREIYAKREILKVSYLGKDNAIDPFEQADRIGKLLKEVFEVKNNDDWKDMSQIGCELVKHIELVESGTIQYMSTGIKQLDKINGGFKAGNLIVIGARPSVGKSAYMGKIALNNAHKGYKVGIIPLEMDSKDVTARMVSLDSGIEHWKIDRALWQDEMERDIVMQTISDMSTLPIRMADSTDVNITDIRIKVAQLKRKHGIDMLIIDYLQLIGTDKAKNKNREQEVAELSRGLKILAMTENIPVIILAQLNRQSDARSNKKPQLSDLRESGAIEQDADVVILLHRDEMAGIPQDENGNSTEGQADIIAAKWRNGATISLKLGFNKQKMKFFELDEYSPFDYSEPSKETF